jgi:isopentenyl diphosphate isomerase/L-lactate dehydrogenase-like FMN-dependent dehydrogenase
MLGTMKRDLEVTMALTGCRSVVEVNRDVLVG